MANESMKLRVKTGEKDGKNFSNDRSQAPLATRDGRPDRSGGLLDYECGGQDAGAMCDG